jgi:hypothetical protein
MVALRPGSVSMPVERGTPAILCENEEQLTVAVRLLDEMARARCRRAAEQ